MHGCLVLSTTAGSPPTWGCFLQLAKPVLCVVTEESTRLFLEGISLMILSTVGVLQRFSHPALSSDARRSTFVMGDPISWHLPEWLVPTA